MSRGKLLTSAPMITTGESKRFERILALLGTVPTGTSWKFYPISFPDDGLIISLLLVLNINHWRGRWIPHTCHIRKAKRNDVEYFQYNSPMTTEHHKMNGNVYKWGLCFSSQINDPRAVDLLI